MNLKKLRIKYGMLRQKDFAKALRLKTTTVSMWETGKAVPRFETMQKIAIVLSCQLSEVTECFIKKQ